MKDEKQTTDEKKTPKVVFENAKNYGEEIEALVRYYTGSAIGDWPLREASKQVEKNNKRLDEYKAKILDEGDDE